MERRRARCPRCRREYPWGHTVCPACHVGLELFDEASPKAPPTAPTVPVFETGDRSSADIVAGLLAANGLMSVIRGTDDAVHLGIGRAGYWHVLVLAEDATEAQEILDAEIGREDAD